MSLRIEKHPARLLSILLNGYGYNCGEADGDFSAKTTITHIRSSIS